jgi:hypothetical protein
MSHSPYETTIAGSQALPPYDGTDIRVFVFPLLANAEPLQILCDQCLNIAPAAAGITFEPALSELNTCTVIMEALDYPSLKATTPPWDDFGATAQRELLFSFPVVRKQGGAPVEFGIFIPYIFVDDQGSSLTGREVLGLPKLLATFPVFRNFPMSGAITMRFPGRRMIGGPVQQANIVRIAAVNNFAPLGIPTLTTTSMPAFSTRVLINPQTPAMDSYRSIMRSVYSSTTTAMGLLPPAKVILSQLLHLDIQETLGIVPDALGNVISSNPYFLDSSLSLGEVTTLWES